jgi:hypothetical protein
MVHDYRSVDPKVTETQPSGNNSLAIGQFDFNVIELRRMIAKRG